MRPRRRTGGVDKSVKTADWGLPGEQGTRPKGDGADRIAGRWNGGSGEPESRPSEARGGGPQCIMPASS